MCIPHGSGGTKDNSYIDIKPKKHIQKVSQEEFEHGDSNFVDERILQEVKEKKATICDRIFGK